MLQDFTGVPAVVDLATMRSAMKRLGGDPKKINPLVPVDLVIDHSVQVDQFGSPEALAENIAIEFQRNRERYEFLRWGQKAFRNFRVVPPGVGIIHQVNLEFLAKCVACARMRWARWRLPDTLVGTDSHTTMINGLGVVGWGVGGIEAEAIMLGQPLYMLAPEVVGFELSGELPPGTTPTDLVLTDNANPPHRGRGRQVRRVLRPGNGEHEGGRPGAGRQHGAGIWSHDGLLPRRRADVGLSSRRPAAPWPKSIWSSATRRSNSCSARAAGGRRRRCRTIRRCCGWTWQRSSPTWPGPSGRKTACRWST